ncbi:hypothetical protein, partial [Salmonella enterica]|uniref:hypothetical protein n=1 Tax=Salmonella enterica TaxID=28901 RepID=UPI00329849FB
ALFPEQFLSYNLPYTPMAKAVKEILHPELMEEKRTCVSVGGGGVNVNTGKGKPGGGTHVIVGRKGVGVNTGKPGGGTH